MVVKMPRVVIVGAGMAGITAAHRLHAAFSGDLFDLCIVEASHRIGGRILTSEFAGDRVEMGATWIHGIGGSPIHAIAGDIGALADDSCPWERMDGFPSDPVTVAEGGAVVDPNLVVAPITSLYRRLMDLARAGDAPVDPKRPGVGPFLRQGLQEYRASRGGGGDIGGWSLEELEEAVFAMHEFTEHTCTSADDLKQLDLAAEGEYRDYPGDQITIAQGYSRVVEYLAASLPRGMIRLGRRLQRIEWCPGGDRGGGGPVRLHFEGEHPAMAADHVIVTVSLGVLKAGLGKGVEASGGVVFSPALPAFKREAIGRLGFGAVNKLFMEMEGSEEGGRFPFLQMAFAQDEEGRRRVAGIPRWMRSTASICPIYGGSRVLLAWFAGKQALQLEELPDEEVIRGVHATLDAFRPASATRAAPRISRVKRSGWGRDPLFLGSYSYVAVGSSGDDLDLMAEPLPRRHRGGDDLELEEEEEEEEEVEVEVEEEDKDVSPPPLQLLFAGEATHRTHYSTTHGAYLSGIREANRLLQHYRYA